MGTTCQSSSLKLHFYTSFLTSISKKGGEPLHISIINTTYMCLWAGQMELIDQLTNMLENGDSQKNVFPSFLYNKQQNESISTCDLHCITRLCQSSTCSTFKEGRHSMHFNQKSPIGLRLCLLCESHKWYNKVSIEKKSSPCQCFSSAAIITSAPAFALSLCNLIN